MSEEKNREYMNKHRRSKPGLRVIGGSGEAYVAQENVHDVAERATPDKREAHIATAYDRFCDAEKDMPDDIKQSTGARTVFAGGFNAGEGYGHTIGFSRGAIETAKGLTVSKGRASRQLYSGNYIGTPETKLEALNQEQLTAEICALLAQYAIVPTDLKVAAVLDALNTLPGVDIKFGERDRAPREQS